MSKIQPSLNREFSLGHFSLGNFGEIWTSHHINTSMCHGHSMSFGVAMARRIWLFAYKSGLQKQRVDKTVAGFQVKNNLGG